MHHFESTEIVNIILDTVVEKCGKILYHNYIQSKICGYNVTSMIDWQCGVINQEFLPMDHGESKYAIMNKWAEEDEQVHFITNQQHFKTIDNMTAKSVKIKKLVTNMPDSGNEDQKSMQSGASSSRFSSNSKFHKTISKIKLINKLGGSSTASLATAMTEEFKVKIIKMPDDSRPPTPDPIIDRLREQRELITLDRQRENERMRKIKEEQQEYEEKKKDQQKQLRNKQYTYDYDGQIVFLTTKPVDLQINEVASSDYKTNMPIKIIKDNKQQPEIKPVKEGYAKQDEEHKNLEKAQAVEYPKQPSLVEAMKPKVGVNILFDGGFLKEGGEFKVGNKISKKDYQEMLDGLQQKKPKPQYEMDDEMIEKEDSLQLKLHMNAVNNSQRKIKIQNEDHYLWMMEDDKKSQKSPKSSSAESKKIPSPKQQILKKSSVLKKSKLERINAYKKMDDFKGNDELRASRMHKIVKEFDNKLISNPMAGYVVDKEIPPPSSTVYKLKHAQKSQPQLPPLRKY